VFSDRAAVRQSAEPRTTFYRDGNAAAGKHGAPRKGAVSHQGGSIKAQAADSKITVRS